MLSTDLLIPADELHSVPKIHDRLFRVPGGATAQQFNFPGWDHPELFGNDNPVQIEYCSGNGCWIAAKAYENPHLNWVAVEMKLGRSRKIWSKIKKRKLPNLIVVNGEGHTATAHFFPKDSVANVYINFPDPWPKRRHAHHRIIQTAFLNQLARILNDDGKVIFVTDDIPYSEWTIGIFQTHPSFKSQFSLPYFAHEWPDYGESYFNALWRQQGRHIRYHCFMKQLT